jgi:hypothetical protein
VPPAIEDNGRADEFWRLVPRYLLAIMWVFLFRILLQPSAGIGFRG